eukprot:5276899-Lingulodinium_polyedra.AAC.1
MKRFIRKASPPMSFNTANGITHAEKVLKIDVEECASSVQPYILDNTPNVLSVGMRCVQHGYSFIWPAKENPYFILPDDRVVQFEVVKYIPYLQPGKPFCRPRRRKGQR